eukprot:GHVS01078388.1.p2 GENE.GHVS01078388.1~~GHVS01078388.1.p2  ORF type:complete len:433 (+),score=75.54 GHVS01078388.1:107-1405(+)
MYDEQLCSMLPPPRPPLKLPPRPPRRPLSPAEEDECVGREETTRFNGSTKPSQSEFLDSQWGDYFDLCLDVPLPSSCIAPSDGGAESTSNRNLFRVYVCASPNTLEDNEEQAAPVSAEPSSLGPSVDRIGDIGRAGVPLLVLLHGGGHSAMSWAAVAKRLRPHLFVTAFDLRCHGQSRCGREEDLSMNVLVDDAAQLIDHVYSSLAGYVRRCEEAQTNNPLREDISGRLIMLGPSRGIDPTCNGIVLVGHSMGGALAGHLAASGRVSNLLGLVVVDAVEGTAIEALPAMQTFIRRLPKSFASPLEAVRWAVDSKTLLNEESARLSIPSQLTQRPSDLSWRWTCDLAATELHWRGWFTGLSCAFLSARCPKMLVLAGHDRLDKQLMIAHMQGKFQLQVVLKSGHVIMEDQPEEVTKVLLEFVRRYKLLKEPHY